MTRCVNVLWCLGMPRNRITLLRNTQGLKPVDVASKLGVTERTAWRWERGEVQIPDDKKLALASLFGVTVGFLMGWPEENGNGDEGVAA